MISRAYSSDCSWIFDSLFADALSVMICSSQQQRVRRQRKFQSFFFVLVKQFK
jgi:hypothetical protein